MSITAEQIAELKAALEKATKGEWESAEANADYGKVVLKFSPLLIAAAEEAERLREERDSWKAQFEYEAANARSFNSALAKSNADLDGAIKEAERLSSYLMRACHAMRETLWMARRYADGRNTYAPRMLNDAVRTAIELGAIDDAPSGEPVFAADPLGAHSSGLSDDEYQRVVASRSNFERVVAEERRAAHDAAFASGKREGLEAAAKSVEHSMCDVAEDEDRFMQHRDYFAGKIRALIEEPKDNVDEPHS